MTKEIWKDIPNYNDYKVSNLGRVKSVKFFKEKILKQCLNSNGYLIVSFSMFGKVKKFKTHQLVAMSFLNHKPCGMKLVINHINFNKLDNNVENLEITTQRENTNLKHINSSSNYTGVHWNKNRNCWNSQIQINGKIKYLGSFKCELSASIAYQSALKLEYKNQA